MSKRNLSKVKKPGKKNIYFDVEASLNLAYILENSDEYNQSSAIQEGLKRVKKSVEKKVAKQETETNVPETVN